MMMIQVSKKVLHIHFVDLHSYENTDYYLIIHDYILQ